MQLTIARLLVQGYIWGCFAILCITSREIASLLHVVLYEPEIPPNTGNIIRLAANTGVHLHLIEPLGFDLGEKKLRRAGLDYQEMSQVRIWPDWQSFLDEGPARRLFALTTKGTELYCDARFQPGDALLFGPETRGLPSEILQSLPAGQKLRLPMQTGSRSLNLSNSVAVVLYEALRQTGFIGLE